MMVERKGVGKSIDDTFAENRILYRGHENPIHYKRLDNIRFEGARSQPGKTQPGRPTTWKDTTRKDTTRKRHNLEETQSGRDKLVNSSRSLAG